MDKDRNILIQRYLDDDLSKAERLAFEQELIKDPALRDELEKYKMLIQGVQAHERAKMKAVVAGITSQIPKSEVEEYSPKKPPKPGGGSSIGGILRSLIFFASIMGVAFFALIYFGQFPFEHPAVEKIQEKIIQLEKSTSVHVDTVTTVIETDKVDKDTTLYDSEEARKFLEELEISKP